MKAPLFETSPQTRLLVERLRNTAVGDVVTYEALSAEISRNVKEEARHNLYRAKLTLEREAIIFEIERGVGLRRVGAPGALDAVQRHGVAIRRHAARGRRILVRVPTEELEPQDRIRQGMLAAVMGAVSLFTGKATSRKLLASAKGHDIPDGRKLAMDGIRQISWNDGRK